MRVNKIPILDAAFERGGGGLTACINHFFYFLYSDALTSGALLTLEGLSLPGLVNS